MMKEIRKRVRGKGERHRKKGIRGEGGRGERDVEGRKSKRE